MKKIQLEKPFSTDIKLNRKNHIYNLKYSLVNKSSNKTLQISPEKECSSINELVKKSVEKINNLFQQKIFSESDVKSYNSNYNNIKNNSKQKDTFHSINTIEDIDKNNKIKNEDDLSEGQNINSCSIIDVSALKRNFKHHSFDFKNIFKSKKDSKNQIDYIQKSNQNEKKYVIQNNENYKTLFNPKSALELQDNNNTPLKTKKSNLYQSEIIKNMSDEKYPLDLNMKIKQNRRNKYYSFYRYNHSPKENVNKINVDLINTFNRKSPKKYFDLGYNKAISIKTKGIKNERYNSLRSNNYQDNTSKNLMRFNFINLKIQKMNQIKINSSINNNKKNLYKSKTHNHFMNINNSQIMKQIYSKEFPQKIKTNDILKLMLFLNEYIINNNFLDDYYIKSNRKILDEYSKFLADKININYPNESDIICDDFINKTKIIQRNWRKIKIKKYMEINKYEEEKEIKKMVMNNYINKAGFKIKKFFGLFHNLVEQFSLLDCDILENDINKCFYYMKKIIINKLSNYEKSELYKDYINKIIYMN